MAYDYFNNPISVGDEVAFHQTGYRHFVTGTVESLTDKCVNIVHEATNTGKEKTKQFHNQVIVKAKAPKDDGNAMKSAEQHKLHAHLDAMLKFVEGCYMTEYKKLKALPEKPLGVDAVEPNYFLSWEDAVTNKLDTVMTLIRSSYDEGESDITISERTKSLIKVIIEGWAGVDKYVGNI
jgi:hypothetical protein